MGPSELNDICDYITRTKYSHVHAIRLVPAVCSHLSHQRQLFPDTVLYAARVGKSTKHAVIRTSDVEYGYNKHVQPGNTYLRRHRYHTYRRVTQASRVGGALGAQVSQQGIADEVRRSTCRYHPIIGSHSRSGTDRRPWLPV